MEKTLGVLLMLSALGWVSARTLSAADPQTGKPDYPIRAVPLTSVRLTDHVWKPRIVRNHQITIPAILGKLHETGRVRNFLGAARVLSGQSPREPFCSSFSFDDSDLYKLIEAASWSLMSFSDPPLSERLDELIATIGSAQESDGYLFTNRTLDPDHPLEMSGKTRWEKEDEGSHELYNAGHLYEAAYAHFLATQQRSLLQIALKNAEMVDRTFGWGKLQKAPNHQGIEMGLVKLYRATGEERWLELARFFLEVRGYKGDAYSQQHQTPVQQTEAVGHAVRGTYMYSGMADVAALTGNVPLRRALFAIWENAAGGKTYITGGIGSTSDGEAFGKPFELPNHTAYCETCAAIGNAFWNQRMFLLTGDARYVDLLERVLYNGFLSGVSLSGDRFFYPNPLESWGNRTRREWFACACCPPNVARLLPSLPGYFYATAGDRVFVNLFAENQAEIDLPGGRVSLEQTTNYPWEGKVTVTVRSSGPGAFSIALRVPGWARNRAFSSDLYRFIAENKTQPTVLLNGKGVVHSMENGYAVVTRSWTDGDTLVLDLPMPVRTVLASPRVLDDVDRLALQRGPLVYCAEGLDNRGSALTLVVDQKAILRSEPRPTLLNGVTVITGNVRQGRKTPSGVKMSKASLLAIPYYAWANRQPSDMTVWFATQPGAITHFPEPPTIATSSQVSASYAYDNSLSSVNDGFPPKSSADRSNNALRFYPHTGTTEWIRYDLRKPATVSSAKVYWLQDDAYLLPAGWRVLYLKDDGEWEEVKNPSPYLIEADRFNIVTFDKVTTKALKLEVVLRDGGSGGIIEWAVDES